MQGGNSSVYFSDSQDTDKALATEIDYRSSVGALTFLVYDICISMDDEINFVWPKPWTRTKFLYLFIRYVPLFVQISILAIGSRELTPALHFTPHDCFIWQVYQGVATVLIFTAVDYVLILRVYALYNNNRTIRRLVLVAFALELCGMGVGLGLSLPGIQFDAICVVTSISDALLIYAGSALIFQTFLFTLTVFKFVKAVREGWGDAPLLGLVMRDGTWAFFLLFAVISSNLYGLKNNTFANVLYAWLLSTFSFAGYHVLLNLDRLSDVPLGTSQSTTNDSPYQFTTRIITDREQANSERELAASHELAIFSGPSGSGTSG
ncbi:hypothetical protein C8F04DRAFT_1255265 [Mycena alexandri]|uniref:DUF6533 domain-containing protein n=1 Tax=Mycena alexandri TaxID=1745969 RepID=A0AAD6T7B3_9AGAR|nr:hypothetical protein C8F04DRAFT_1255265 [Mycena alexandri]